MGRWEIEKEISDYQLTPHWPVCPELRWFESRNHYFLTDLQVSTGTQGLVLSSAPFLDHQPCTDQKWRGLNMNLCPFEMLALQVKN